MRNVSGEAKRPAVVIWAALLFICMQAAHSVIAQEDQPAAEEGVAESAAPAPHEVSKRRLELQLAPLRRDEVAELAEEWILLLQDKVAAISARETASLEAEGEEKTAIQEEAVALNQEKAALIERVNIVLAELKLKGGDAEEYEQYVTAVSGISIDVTDTTGAWIFLRNWITSGDGGINVGLNIVKAIVTLVIFWILARIIGAIVKRAVMRVRGASALLKDFLGKLTRKVVLVIGAVVAISMLGVNIGPLVAAIGAAGLVIGFALQGTLSNFASGILILLYRPFDVGDWVEAGGVAGKVQAMSLLTTTLLKADNQVTIVPNNSIWNNIITNVTGSATRRVDLKFGIGYPDDIDRAKEVLLDVMKSHPLVLEEPEPVVQVHELAESSVNLIARPWVKTSDYWTVYWEITAEVKRRFDKEGIGIPFPQMDVHLHGAVNE